MTSKPGFTTRDPARVYWLTGLSGAGKSTLARKLVAWLREQGRIAVLLDGDELRAALDVRDAHTLPDRLALALCYARLSRLLCAQGLDVVIATISLFHAIHAWNRSHLPGYVEILVDVPLAELRRRDPKQLYARLANGAAQDVIGCDLEPEMPLSPDCVIRFRDGMNADVAFDELIETLTARLR